MKTKTFIFVREGGFFYPIDIPPQHLQANIDLNPGSIRVETPGGKVLWRASKH